MSPETIAALGAFLTGLASLASAMFSLRVQKKKAADECDKRIKEIRRAFREGMEVQRKQHEEEEDEDRWSHLP